MDILAKVIIDLMVRNEIILEQDKEVYLFGMIFMLRTTVNIFSSLCIGILFNMIGESIVFIVFSLLIRTYSGGFHFDSPIKCYLLSIINVILMLLVIRFQVFNIYISFFLTFFSVAIIMKYAPIEHKSKPLESIEKNFYRKKVFKIVVILILLMILFLLFNYRTFLYSASCSFGLSSFMILICIESE